MTTNTKQAQPATKAALLTMAWDPNLNGYRSEGGLVKAVKCGLLLAEDQATMQPGDVFFRLISASFIDEVASQGKHEVTVDVIDESGRRLNGAVAQHGWPWEVWPGHDGLLEITVFGAEPAKWEIWADYPADRTEYGPYWVKTKGASDVFFGMGLPFKHHVSFVAVFQRMVWGDVNPPDPGTGGEYDDRLAALKADTSVIRAKLEQVFR